AANMRWVWIDRFLELETGSHARAVKNITLSEEHLHDHFPGFPMMPASLMLEGMAQVGGILLGSKHNFQRSPLLATVPRVTFHSCGLPGDTVIYTVKLPMHREDGGVVSCTAHVGDRLVAEAEIVYVFFEDTTSAGLNADMRSYVFSRTLMSAVGIG